MTLAIVIVLLVAMCLFVLSGLRAARTVTSLRDFFSFGKIADPQALNKAFTVTNASFTTSFATLFFLGLGLGFISFAIPVGFLIGIIAYVLFLLPYQMTHLQRNVRYPQLIGELTGSRNTRRIVSMFVVFSLFLFTFAELQGLQLFLTTLLADAPRIREYLPPVLIVLIAWYTAQSGYRAVIGNDHIQFTLIILGTGCIFLLWGTWLASADHAKVWALGQQLYGATSGISIARFVAQALVGFIFSQLIYYDNWQRLSFYVAARMSDAASDRAVLLDQVEKEIRRNYLIGAVYLLLIYAAPIAMSLQAASAGALDPSFLTLAKYFRDAWIETIIAGLNFGPVLVIGAILFMVAALVSTAEVYIVGLVNSVLEDILGYDYRENVSDRKGRDALIKTRFITALACLLLIPLLFLEPNFQNLFDFMFYSANGFVGPVLCVLFGIASTPWRVTSSLLFGIVYSLPPLLYLPFANYFQVPGVVVVVVSIPICFVGSHRAIQGVTNGLRER
jgi:Na+/proline symporter